jgi:hypothetical protein
MRIFSKIVFIFNACFIAAAILRLVEMVKRSQGNMNAAIPLAPLENALVLLGYSAIFINIVFALSSFYWIITRKINLLPRWIVFFNLLLFPIQVWYFFFSNF